MMKNPPLRLRIRNIPSLSALGDEGLIKSETLGLICSKRCAGDVIVKTYEFARIVRESRLTVISGFHSPIEKDCLPILLRGAGSTVIVQGRKLSTSRLPLDWQKAIEAGRLLLLSPFSDREKRVTTELATERNRLVAALADEVLIPYAHPGSKTEALFRDLCPSGKRVYTFESPANATLISAGAIAVSPEFFGNNREAMQK